MPIILVLRNPKEQYCHDQPLALNPVYSGPYMGSCQNYGPFLGTLNNRCRTILRTQKGTLILTTTHMYGALV